MHRKIFSFSPRSDVPAYPAGGSMASMPTTCSMWFWTTSRMAPTSS